MPAGMGAAYPIALTLVSGTAYDLTAAFAIVCGTAAGLLALLAWETLRQSPFGRAVFVLSVVMVVFTSYHVLVLLAFDLPPVVQLFKSVLFTGVAAFIWMMVWSQYRVRSNPVEDRSRP